MAFIYVALGGALGSMARYAVMMGIGRLQSGVFPWGTFMVNISGGFIMGIWISTMAHLLPERARDLHLLFAVGVLGGFTTFSTFSLDAYTLIERGQWGACVIYIGGSVVLSIIALIAGMACVRMVAG